MERLTEPPSHSTIWRRVQELGAEKGLKEFECDGFVSADGTRLHLNPKSGRGKLEVKAIAGKSAAVRVNDIHGINGVVVGDTDKDLGCFEEEQIDLIHV
ncbi:MAG: hypothetical protein SBU_000254 [Candidatus Syntrophoarchaeum butanivorans]|uniref:Uncharacterized protein n=1 Tax=Candidatus Syntropharchaeum butanivorans TaxID=1839936 RepID=A0A1F2P8E6_9EURY|nr:MAG: hypothetical protein SBU_000254 [Candidatus Syntrophoarchaeum butanivorans]